MRPHPTNQNLTIVGADLDEILEIYSVSGGLIYSTKIGDNVETVDCKDFDSGIYFIKVKSNGIWNTVKFSKL